MIDFYRGEVGLVDAKAKVGHEFGLSRWFEIGQDRINAFADATEDWLYIHTDPERAAREAPYGGTIAHGFLTASMLAAMGIETGIDLDALIGAAWFAEEIVGRPLEGRVKRAVSGK